MFKLEVEIPAYCAIPYNNVYCRFLQRKIIGTPTCQLYAKELKEAKDALYEGSGVLIPCGECEKSRKI